MQMLVACRDRRQNKDWRDSGLYILRIFRLRLPGRPETAYAGTRRANELHDFLNTYQERACFESAAR